MKRANEGFPNIMREGRAGFKRLRLCLRTDLIKRDAENAFCCGANP